MEPKAPRAELWTTEDYSQALKPNEFFPIGSQYCLEPVVLSLVPPPALLLNGNDCNCYPMSIPPSCFGIAWLGFYVLWSPDRQEFCFRWIILRVMTFTGFKEWDFRLLGWWYLDKTSKLQWYYNGLRHMEMLGLGGYILHKKGCESLGARRWTIVGWTVASKFVQVSIPWICEYVTLYGRRDFEDMNKLRILKWDFLELSRWARYSQGSS